MAENQTTNTINLDHDLRDERREYLQFAVMASAAMAIILFIVLMQVNQRGGIGFHQNAMLILLGASGAGYVLLKRGNLDTAGYVYLVGLTLTIGSQLWVYGPNVAISMLLAFPIVLSCLVLKHDEILYVTIIVSIVKFVFTALGVGLGGAIIPTIGPVILYGLVAAVVYAKSADADERIRWTLDSQHKDNRRAEMFYDQSEQLQKALLQVQHYSSRLENLNKQLEQAQQKAEQASKAKSTFLSNMSHELRTPLNVIIGYSNSMLNMPKMFQNKKVAEVHRPYLKLIEDNGHYLLGLINDTLDLSKIEAGKLELHRTETDLEELFRSVIATSVGLLKGKPVQIRGDFPTDLPRIWADPMRVRQIILNLMSNAIKFTDTGSVTLSAAVDGEYVNIGVTDTGIGIPDHALAAIFDRFQQAESDTDKKYGGTGLGLDISKQLSLMHGGDLTVKSAVGRGSTFMVRLPIERREDESDAQEDEVTVSANPLLNSEGEAGDPQMVLLVEDDVNTRQLMHQTLEIAGYVVVDTHSGEEALELALGLLPAAILLDVYLPDVNGWDVVGLLHANPETAAIPVVVCTADHDRSGESGHEHLYYLAKPATPDKVLHAMAQALTSAHLTLPKTLS
ncbi:MAG: response regulator [Anaerolineae bacterium]|nr:response regulator [Anaerolineae bacterium]